MISTLANSLVPVFLCLLLGYVAGVRKIVDNKDVKSIITFVMGFALPCSLFVTIAHTPHQLLWSQGRVIAVLTATYLAIYVATYLIARSQNQSEKDSAVLALTLGFPNATAVGLPLLAAVFGSQTLVVVVIAIAVGSITISPITLTLLEAASDRSGPKNTAMRLRGSLKQALKRPVCWSPVLGIVFVLCNLSLPTYLERTLTLLSNTTAGVALFLTGLMVSAQRLHFNRAVCAAVFTKNFLQPVVCLGLAILFKMPSQEIRYLVLISAIPCGFFGIVFGKGFGATPATASSSLIVSYLVGIISLAGWIVILNHLH